MGKSQQVGKNACPSKTHVLIIPINYNYYLIEVIPGPIIHKRKETTRAGRIVQKMTLPFEFLFMILKILLFFSSHETLSMC